MPHLDKIEKNTLLLFFRMAVLMLISVVAVRFVRSAMGVENYGVFTAITGLVQMLICLNTVLATASQRYLSVAIAQQDDILLCNSFRAALRLSKWLCVGIFILFETVGFWFVLHKLQFPHEQQMAVILTYQFTLLSFLLTIIQVPWLAVVMAREKMNWFAFVTILEAGLKLGIALILPWCTWNVLAVYAAGLLVCSVLSTALYIGYDRKHFAETIPSANTADTVPDLISPMAHFGGWSLFGNIAGILMLQGNLLLLNVYCGPRVNADFAIAMQVFGAFIALGNNVIFAVRPQMTMAYVNSDYSKLNRLFLLSSAVVFGLMLLVAVPLTIWMPWILTMWLGDTTSLMVSLCRLMIINILIQSLGNQFTIVMQAADKVKEYHLVVETMSLLSFPLSWLFLYLGYEPETTVWIMIGCMTIAHFLRIERVYRYYYNFPLWRYLFALMLPIGLFLCGFVVFNLVQ